MEFKQNRRIRKYSPLIAMVSVIFLLTACGGGNSTGSGNSSNPAPGTGELFFDVIFHDVDDSIQRQAAVTDCDGLGIDTVEAMVTDHTDGYLASGGPWECDKGQGYIYDVPAGSGRKVAIIAKDSIGTVVYRGQRTDVNVMVGDNNIGTIRCKAFVPSLQAPADGSVAVADAVELAWTAVEGASKYQVVVSEDENLNNLLIDRTTPNATLTPSDLSIGKTYYWRVGPIDIHDNKGTESQIWSFKTNNPTYVVSNLLLDPTFSKTTANSDNRYWHGTTAIEWGASYGYNSTPGFRIAIDGKENWMANSDGNSQLMKHPVKVGDRLWIQFRLKRSAGADGIFRVGIQEWDGENNIEDNVIRNTITDISSIAPDETWELVTASVTVYDANTVFCNLLISPNGGTTGYFYIDDVVFSRQEPVPDDNSVNLLSDPTLSKTTSNNDYKHWLWTEAIEWGSSYGNNSSPGIRFTIDGNDHSIVDADGQGNQSKHSVVIGQRLWIQCRVKRSMGTDGKLKLGILEFDKNNNGIANIYTDVSTYAPDDTWELVSASVNVFKSDTEFCSLIIQPYGGTTGHFHIDDVFLSRHDIAITENASNMVSDPTFSKTKSNDDHKYWQRERDPSATMWEWGSAYGFNSSPGFQFTIDGDEHMLFELDGSSIANKHPVQIGDKLWIQCRIKRSAGTDGIFRIGIHEMEKDFTSLRFTTTVIDTSAADSKWEVVTASVTVSDPNAAYCHLLIWPYSGTVGHYYIDDVVFSRHPPY